MSLHVNNGVGNTIEKHLEVHLITPSRILSFPRCASCPLLNVSFCHFYHRSIRTTNTKKASFHNCPSSYPSILVDDPALYPIKWDEKPIHWLLQRRSRKQSWWTMPITYPWAGPKSIVRKGLKGSKPSSDHPYCSFAL